MITSVTFPETANDLCLGIVIAMDWLGNIGDQPLYDTSLHDLCRWHIDFPCR